MTGLLILSAAAQGQWPTKAWLSSTPRDLGLDANVLSRLDTDITAGKFGYVDSVLIIRHGKIAHERTYKHNYESIYGQEARTPGPLNAHDPSGPYNFYNSWWHPFYQRSDLHTIQSVTKTVTSVVTGIALSRQQLPSLDTPILTFFDIGKVANVDDRKRRMTLRHVLTMTTGLEWNEGLPYADPNNAVILMEIRVRLGAVHY